MNDIEIREVKAAMDTRFLEYILVLAETGNMTKAAKKLYVSQPTLSQFLARHEAEIGVPLFERKNGKYSLTPAGELYADYARLVLSLTDKLEKDIHRLCTATHILVGTSTSSAIRAMVRILPDFCKAYPQVELTMIEHRTLRASDAAIRNGEVDIALSAVPSLEPYEGYSVGLWREEVRLVVPCGHPFAQSAPRQGRQSVTRAEFDQYFKETPLIQQLPGSCIRYLVDAFLDGRPHITVCNTNNAQSVCDMVGDNMGIGFVPEGYAAGAPGVAAFSLEPKLYRTHALLYRRDLELSPPYQLLIELTQKYYKIRKPENQEPRD